MCKGSVAKGNVEARRIVKSLVRKNTGGDEVGRMEAVNLEESAEASHSPLRAPLQMGS